MKITEAKRGIIANIIRISARRFEVSDTVAEQVVHEVLAKLQPDEDRLAVVAAIRNGLAPHVPAPHAWAWKEHDAGAWLIALVGNEERAAAVVQKQWDEQRNRGGKR